MGRKETRYIDSGLAAAIPWTLFDDTRVLATPQAARDLSGHRLRTLLTQSAKEGW